MEVQRAEADFFSQDGKVQRVREPIGNGLVAYKSEFQAELMIVLPQLSATRSEI